MKSTIGNIKSILKEIGKSKFKYEESINDYTYNGSDASALNQEYYLNLHKDFTEHFATLLLDNKVDKFLIEFLFKATADYHNTINQNKGSFRVNYLFLKDEKNLRDLNKWTREVINSIMDAQKSTLKFIYNFLNNLYGNLDYLTFEDKQNFKNEFAIEESNSQIINHPSMGKVNLKGTKKNGLCLLFLLEHFDLIDFQNTDRNIFIETNFTYGKNKEMLDVNSDISNLYENTEKVKIARNRNSTKKLIKTLTDSLENFDFNNFLSSRKY